MLEFMKNKDEISREMVHDKKMKIIILRLDYIGVTDLIALISAFESVFSGSFSMRQEVYNNQLNVSLRAEDLNSISESLSVPVNVIRKEKLWRYSGLKDVMCKTSLDISQYYLCLTIMCEDNYDGLDIYMPYFERTVKAFKDNNRYFRPKRLGLRKNRVEKFEEYDNIASTFEKSVFCMDNFFSCCEKHIVKNYIDVVRNTCSNDLQVNINRKIEPVVIDDKEIYKTALDIDAYYQSEEILNSLPIDQLLSNANNYEFEIYKSCMTQKYLNQIM